MGRCDFLANIERIKYDIENLRVISQTCAAGVTRVSYTPQYRQGVDYIKSEMLKAELDVREDEIGNIFGVIQGIKPDSAKIISGSHLDTVLSAGAFDGIAGVVCALEVARMIKESGKHLRHSYEVIGTIEEEGTRFGQVLLGSQFTEGTFTQKDIKTIVGYDGLTLEHVLKSYGKSGDVSQVCRRDDKVKAFIELHVEQGPVLENAGTSIGVVDNIVAISWINIIVYGTAGHSGTVPMDCRQDAGVGAAQLITAINQYVSEKYTGKATVTVGKLDLEPGAANCIPSECKFTVDTRTSNNDYIKDIISFIQSEAKEVEQRYNVKIDVNIASSKDPVKMDSDVTEIIEKSCRQLGHSYMHLDSGAGHDAMVFARMWKTGMIFVPSVGGLSHHPNEYTSFTDIAKGTDVLYEVIRKIDVV